MVLLRSRLILVATIALGAPSLLWAASAAAQEGGAPPMSGQGVAVAPDRKAELHVGIEAGAGLDTNPYSTPTSRNVFAGDLTARLRPSASVDYPGSLIGFKGEGVIEYGFLPGMLGNTGTQEFLLYQSLLAGDLELNRDGFLRFAVGDSFSWNSDPGNMAIGSVFNRIQNQLRAGVGLKPGGGALTAKLGYAFDFIKFLNIEGDSDIVQTGQLDNMLHTLALRADYKFLPRTGGFLALQGGWSSYPFDSAGVNETAFPVAAQLGVQGQLFAKVAGLASLGYSNPLVLDDAGAITTGTLIGVVGQAEVQWQPSLSTNLGGGFKRDFSPAPLYQYVGNNRFYVSLSQVLGGRFHLAVNSGYSILEFGQEQAQLSTATTDGFLRLDGHLDAAASLAYYFTDWLSVGLVDKVDWRVTNAANPAPDVGDGNYGFVRNQTMLTVAAKY
ncbi:MAG: outer membrane beta-barrel protein [Deltaproteobacteria bacterium]|nr:outer membrane beta-barrel protein [Deltaproteobacteria bacterium]